MNQVDSIKKILHRERSARKAAEQIIEQKSLELFLVNKELKKFNAELEEKIQIRTSELWHQ